MFKMVVPDMEWCTHVIKTLNVSSGSYREAASSPLRDTKAFWKRIKGRRKSRIHSSMSVDKLADHYSGIMQDNSSFTEEQQYISNHVRTNYDNIKTDIIHHNISSGDVNTCIQKPKRNSSPGIDGITAEYLIHGRSSILCEHLAVLYSAMISYNHVPSLFATGLMVPVLKKPTLDPNFA